jgi:hypothetical protein
VKGWAPHGAWPRLRCANPAGQRQNILWRVGTAARAFGIPNGEHSLKHGYSISFVKESVYTKDCTFGVLMHSFSGDLLGRKMEIDYAEVRLALDYEIRDLLTEVGDYTAGTSDANYPEHLKGRTANNNFQLGLQGFRSAAGETKARTWLTPSAETSKGSAGATVFVTTAVSTASANALNGLRQNKITVVPGNNYTFEVQGRFFPKSECTEPSEVSVDITTPNVGTDLAFVKDSASTPVWRYEKYYFEKQSDGSWSLKNSDDAGFERKNQGTGAWPTDQCAVLSGASGMSSQTAKLWIGDSSGLYSTNYKWSSSSVPTIAHGSVSLDFMAPPGGMIDVGVLISDSKVDDMLTVTKFLLRPRNTLDEHDVQTSAITASECACNPLIHPSMVTRCKFTQSPSDKKRHHVLQVTHQKEHNGKADFHKCRDVGTAAAPKCRCCDCLGGQLHAGAASHKFDINVLKSASSFNVAFNNFSTTEPNGAFGIFKNMHGQCRYKVNENSANEWCCQCKSGECGLTVGEYGSWTESCTAEDATPDYVTISFGCTSASPPCAKAVGRTYTFAHHMQAKQVFQRNGVSGLYDVLEEVRSATQDDEFQVTKIHA